VERVGSLSKVQSYFENLHRENNLVVNFKSMEQFDQEAVKEFRHLQKYKALELMKKLGTKFLA
jgi:uncharacterized protein (DUF1330 family)